MSLQSDLHPPQLSYALEGAMGSSLLGSFSLPQGAREGYASLTTQDQVWALPASCTLSLMRRSWAHPLRHALRSERQHHRRLVCTNKPNLMISMPAKYNRQTFEMLSLVFQPR